MDVTYQSLTRLTYMPDRDSSDNGLCIAGQNYFDVYFTGGEISNVTLINVDIASLSSPLPIQYGGSGQTTANAALNAFLPTQTGNAGRVLKTDGTNTSWSADIDTGITQLTGDATAGPGSGSQAITFATVNANIGSFGSATQVGQVTVNAKGLVTAASNVPIQIAQSQVTNLVTNLAAKQNLDATLTALAAYNTNGLLTQTAADTFTGRTITGTSNRIVVTNGNGVSGNPSLDIGTDVVTLTGSQALTNKSVNGVTLTTGGSSSQFLNGAGSYSAPPFGTLGTAINTTSGIEAGFTGLPSGIRQIILSESLVSTNGDSSVLVQLGASGSYQTSGYTGSVYNFTDFSNFSTGFSDILNAAAGVRNGSFILTHMGSNLWSCNFQLGMSNSGAMRIGAGTVQLSASLDRIRIITANGTDTFDAGTINILYS